MLRSKSTAFAGVLLLAICTTSGNAAEYLFQVPQVQMLVTVNEDASAKIAYDFTFRNTPNGHAIDIVDIGTPTADYSLGNVRAWADDEPLSDIRVSAYVKPGFEVHLNEKTIMPGQEGRLRVEFTVPNMVFKDTTRDDYASLRITPTWFGAQYVQGTTHLQIAIQLPKSVRPEEVLHQGLDFTQKASTPAGVIVGWDFAATLLTGPHQVAVSFPRRDMKRIVEQSTFDLLLKWFRESENARLTLGGIFLVLLAFLYFRFSGGTGFSVYVVLAAGACVVFYISPEWHLIAMPAVVALIGLNEWFLDRRKQHYMPPIAQVEGGGIKRGLTAPEAAVLLELPVAKALSLVIFGMLKKGILRQTQAAPLMVEVNEAFRTKDASQSNDASGQKAACREASVQQGIVVHDFEPPFLFLLERNPQTPVRDIDFSLPMKKLIQDTAARMKGFDLSDTKDYYRAIIRKATEQAAAIGDIPQREKALDRNFEWILMDDGYPTVFYDPYRPVWTRGSTFPTGGGASPTPVPSIPGTTTFGDVASSFTGWAENTMGSLASTISPGSLNLPHPAGGFLDLSGADHVTGEFFKALTEASTSGGDGGGGGWSGGGGGCACAGCACACACAGGGR